MYNDNLTLVFEGIDKSGKSTLIEIMKELYPNLELFDRGFVSDEVYAKKFNRKSYFGVPIKLYLDYWKAWYKSRDTIIIYCKTDLDTSTLRCLEADEPFCKNRDYKEIKDYLQEDRDLFDKCIEEAKKEFKVLEIDTTKSVYTCTEQIKEFINDTKV